MIPKPIRMKRLHRIVTILFLSLLSLSSAFAWWEEGHRTVARLAAAQLTPQARAAIARLLNVKDTPESVANAMAIASTWADEIKNQHPETKNWHFIDIALQDSKRDLPSRCPNNDCIVAQLKQFSEQLNRYHRGERSTGSWSDTDALRFVIHFVGDLHQPLHASSDADLGGNCIKLQAYDAKNLHSLWDGGMLKHILPNDRELTELYGFYIQEELSEGKRKKLAKGSIDNWTWESYKVAKKQIYQKLKVPVAPVVFPNGCDAAPAAITGFHPEITHSYFNEMKPVLRDQIIKAGLRLAKLLNDTFSS